MREGNVIDGRYRVDEMLGQGGMGQVFKGHDQVLNKTVAIKVLFPNTPDLIIKRFHAEAVALGQLKHPNILSVQHFGQSDDGVLYLVTDFIQGESLNAMIENRGAQTFFDVLPIFERICRGLRYAHANNVLHRDIKPSNVMLAMDRSRDDSVQLVDFGLAKQADKDFELTKTGSAMGTPGYMSPEAIQGQEVDERSDIYALGCTFFEMMAGRVPFAEGNALQTMMAHINKLPPTLFEVSGREFELEVEEFVERCLKKDPNERFQNMDELIADLTTVKDRLLVKKESSRSDASSIYASGSSLLKKRQKVDLSFQLLILVGVVVTIGGAAMLWHPSKKNSIIKQDNALRDHSAAETLRKEEDLQNKTVHGVRTGFLYEPGENGEQWLRIYGKLTDKQLQKGLKQYKDSKCYALQSLTVSEDALYSILDLPIEKLKLYDMKLTDGLLKRIAKMKRLYWFGTSNCGDLPVDFLRYFKDSHLSTVNFEMDDKNHTHPLPDLASIKTLKKITLLNSQINRSDIKSIVSGCDLRSLNLGACTIPRDALVDLKLAKNCIGFTAIEVNLTAPQFEDISKIPSLAYLNLSKTNIDDKTLKCFRRCKNLQTLILVDTSVTPTGVEVLKASVPGVQSILKVTNTDPY